jgi:hypothetical protein
MLDVSPENDYVHLGVIAADLRRSVQEIELAAVTLNLLPVRRENGVPIFTVAQAAAIAERLASATPLPQIQSPRHALLPELPRRPF